MNYNSIGKPENISKMVDKGYRRDTKIKLLKEEKFIEEIKGDTMFECCICLETSKDPVVTTCGHLFCWACIY